MAGLLTEPRRAYYFKVRTYTPDHDHQQNALTSVFSAEFSPVTAPGKPWRVYLPMIRKSG